MHQDLSKLTLSELASMCHNDWKKPFFGAVPYLNALRALPVMTAKAMYGFDDAGSIIRYFLGNASAWRGETAKAVKAEFKRRAGIK